ncbi:MAG: hypothetical protein QXP06_03795 [Candidatus Bathyarchaeia archaeon]
MPISWTASLIECTKKGGEDGGSCLPSAVYWRPYLVSEMKSSLPLNCGFSLEGYNYRIYNPDVGSDLMLISVVAAAFKKQFSLLKS